MFLVNIEGKESFRFMRNNKTHQILTGISLEALQGKTPEEFLGKELGEKITRNYAECIKSGQPLSYEETLQLPGGKRTWITTLTPFFKNSKAQYIVGSSQDITERKHLEKALQENERKLRNITDTMGEGLYVMDKQGVVTFVNPAASELLGYTEEEILGQVGHDMFHVHNQHGELIPLQQCPVFQAVSQGKTYRDEDFFQRRDKSIFPVEVIGRPMWENGKVEGSVNAFFDITHRKSVEESLKESEERFRITLENLPGAVFTHDREGRFLLVNRAACKQSGYSREELLQMKVKDIDPQAPAREDIMKVWQNLKSGQSSTVESFHVRKDGSKYPAEVFINAITLNGQPAVLAVAFDISQRKAAEERLRFLATTDELTGLWNRRHFSKGVRNELERARRYQKMFSLLMLDIDYFKKINDTYGHGAGDEVLRHFAHLLMKNLRQMDVAGRVGGEEFSIILPHTDMDGAYAIAERLRQSIAATPVNYQGHKIHFTVSIGIASYQKDIKNEDEMFRMADNALYKAKSQGRNLVAIYENQSLKNDS
ncbi:MAG: diguanylate cyclase, partial [Desulfonatronovibrio sp.]